MSIPNPHAVFSKEYRTSCFLKGDVVIGNDVWIGCESVIMPGVYIGNVAIIAACSVVTRDVPAYGVAGGNPARLLKLRFDEELIALLLEFRWWDLPPEELAEVLPLLCDPDLESVRQRLRIAKREHIPSSPQPLNL